MLESAGHEVVFGLQRPDLIDDEELPKRRTWQAPISPRLMVGSARRSATPTASIADIFARIGMDDPKIVAAMVSSWSEILNAAKPDLVIADFAPFLTMAARGRMPVIKVGPGFACPPSDLEDFPLLFPNAEGIDQQQLLEIVNRGLALAGMKSLDRLPQADGADRDIVVTLTEFDRPALKPAL